jgi:hypothetical protein
VLRDEFLVSFLRIGLRRPFAWSLDFYFYANSAWTYAGYVGLPWLSEPHEPLLAFVS